MKRVWTKITFKLRDEQKEAFWMWLSEFQIAGAWEIDERTVVVYCWDPLPAPPPLVVGEWQEEKEEEEEWGQKWKKYFQTIWIDHDLAVRPPWEKKSGAPLEIVIYPAYAFGTGHHPTTRGCLQLMKKYFRENWSFLDLGTGSGILSILALKMGAKRVCAVDIDPLAIEEVGRNLQLNGLEVSHLELLRGELSVVQGRFDFIAANIGPYFHQEYLPEMSSHLEEKGMLLLSGFEVDDLSSVQRSIDEVGLSVLESLVLSSWVSVVCRR